MAIDFPNSPALNDTFVVGTSTWQYDGEKWLSLGVAGPTGNTGPTGATGLGYAVTSTSSVVLEGLGTRSFTLNTANHAYVTGMRVRAYGTGGGNEGYVEGIATVSGTSMQISVDTVEQTAAS